MIFKGSVKIIRLFGIPVLLHWSFLLLFAWLIYYGVTAGLSGAEFSWILLFSAMLFLCILLHEFGHALVARRYQVDTRDIILLPIGGVARLNKLPDKPMQEMWVALAGPLTNMLIALLLLPYFLWVTMPGLADHELPTPGDVVGNYFFLVPLLLFLNFLLAIFNLIPAFPMDGGRLLRALLSIRMGRLKATRIAVRTGQVIAALMILAGIYYDHFSYTLIGVFIYFTAMRELQWAYSEHWLDSYHVSDVISRDFAKKYLDDPWEGTDEDPGGLVFDREEKLVGVLPAGKKASGRNDDRILDHYQPNIEGVQVTDSLKAAHERMQEWEQDVLPVYENEELAGILTGDMIWEYLFEIRNQQKKRKD